MKIYYTDYRYSFPTLLEIEVEEKPKTYKIISQTILINNEDREIGQRIYTFSLRKDHVGIHTTLSSAILALKEMSERKITSLTNQLDRAIKTDNELADLVALVLEIKKDEN